MRPIEHYPPPPYAAPDQYLDHGRVQFGSRHTAAAGTSRGPKGYQRSDELLSEVISDRLARLAQIDLSDVRFRVDSARVQLDGTVPERWMKYAIEDIASECFGVQEVENRITVMRT
jgi:osmotically-inducible protein OsmY